MSITHAFVSLTTDQADATIVRPSNWNANHLIVAETTAPSSPVQAQWWVEVTGTTPTRIAALKIRDGGVTLTIASITY